MDAARPPEELETCKATACGGGAEGSKNWIEWFRAPRLCVEGGGRQCSGRELREINMTLFIQLGKFA